MGIFNSFMKKEESKTVIDKHKSLIYNIRALGSECKIVIYSDESVAITLPIEGGEKVQFP